MGPFERKCTIGERWFCISCLVSRKTNALRLVTPSPFAQPAGTDDYLPAGVMAVPRSQQVSEAIFEQEENLKKVSYSSSSSKPGWT